MKKKYTYLYISILSLVIIISSLSLLGWITGGLILAQVSGGYIPIAPSTSLFLLFIAIILLIGKTKTDVFIIFISRVSLSLIFLLSAVILLEWLFIPFWDFETVFIQKPERFGLVLSGRMSPLTAFLFLLLSVSIISKNIFKEKVENIYGILNLVTFVISSVLLIGYLYNTPFLYGGEIIPVSLQTGICFWLISFVLLIEIEFLFWPFSLIISNRTEKTLTKVFLPIMLFLLLFISYLHTTIFSSYKNPAVIAAIVLILSIPIIGAIIIFVSKRIGKSLNRVQNSVLESEQRFKKAITHSPYPIMIHSEGKVLQISNSWTEITGYTIEDIPTIMDWSKKAYGQNAYPSEFDINKLYEIKQIQYDGNWEVKIKDGTSRIWEFMTSPIGNLEDGRRVVSSMAVDITDREKSENQLKNKNKRIEVQNEEYSKLNKELYLAKGKLSKLLENLPLPICYVDKNGVMTFRNQRFIDIFGYTEKEVSSLKEWWIKAYPDELYREWVIENWNQAIENASKTLSDIKSEEYKVVCLSGEIRNIIISGITIGDDFLATFVDVTSQKKIEQEIKEKNEEIVTQNEEYKQLNEELVLSKEKAEEGEIRFKALHNASFGGITIHDQGEILDCNQGLSTITGYSIEELIGMDIFLLIEDLSRSLVRQNISKSFEKPYELLGIRKNKETYPLRLEAKSIPYKGKLVSVVEFRDISLQKQGEFELKLAKEKAEENDQLKTEFINNMSHEVRTPMNSILGFSEFLKLSSLSEDKKVQYINIIQNSGNQLLRIIDDIMEISRLGTKQVKLMEKEICLNDLLLEQFSMFDIKAKENEIPLYLNKALKDIDSYVIVDDLKLTKILSNLIENALKFTYRGFVEFGYHIQDGFLVLFVKDTGLGIKKEKQDLIFERFAQEEKGISLKTDGLGLGLSIAKENAELMGGEITLSSELGKGSTFNVRIPYKPVKVEVLPQGGEYSDGSKLKEITVLIVEDEEVNYLYLETILEENVNQNFNVLHAKHGLEAIEFCKENTDINIILMDLKMPILNGFEATKKIKEFLPTMPIIAQTAYSTEEDRKKAISYGCDDFISKPIAEDDLLKLINNYL